MPQRKPRITVEKVLVGGREIDKRFVRTIAGPNGPQFEVSLPKSSLPAGENYYVSGLEPKGSGKVSLGGMSALDAEPIHRAAEQGLTVEKLRKARDLMASHAISPSRLLMSSDYFDTAKELLRRVSVRRPRRLSPQARPSFSDATENAILDLIYNAADWSSHKSSMVRRPTHILKRPVHLTKMGQIEYQEPSYLYRPGSRPVTFSTNSDATLKNLTGAINTSLEAESEAGLSCKEKEKVMDKLLKRYIGKNLSPRRAAGLKRALAKLAAENTEPTKLTATPSAAPVKLVHIRVPESVYSSMNESERTNLEANVIRAIGMAADGQPSAVVVPEGELEFVTIQPEIANLFKGMLDKLAADEEANAKAPSDNVFRAAKRPRRKTAVKKLTRRKAAKKPAKSKLKPLHADRPYHSKA